MKRARRWSPCASPLRNPVTFQTFALTHSISVSPPTMGKNAGAKRRESGPRPQPLASFFPPSGLGQGKAVGIPEGDKMTIPGVEEEPTPAEPVTRVELRADLEACFAKIEAIILGKIKELMAPLNAQLKDLEQNFPQLAQTTDAAMELGLANQESSRHLQKSCDWATEKIMLLENQLKMENLKLHGFPEGCKETKELKAFVSSWLASKMQLEDGVAPLLTNVYRLGFPRHASNALPRDILICCPDMRTKQKLLAATR